MTRNYELIQLLQTVSPLLLLVRESRQRPLDSPRLLGLTSTAPVSHASDNPAKGRPLGSRVVLPEAVTARLFLWMRYARKFVLYCKGPE